MIYMRNPSLDSPSVPLKVVRLSLDSWGESGLGGIYIVMPVLSWRFLMLLRKVEINKRMVGWFLLALSASFPFPNPRTGNMQYITRLPWVVLLLQITETLTISVLIWGTTLKFAVFVITSYRWKSKFLLISWKPSSFDCTGAELKKGTRVNKWQCRGTL
jgi:hypothetical protein